MMRKLLPSHTPHHHPSLPPFQPLTGHVSNPNQDWQIMPSGLDMMTRWNHSHPKKPKVLFVICPSKDGASVKFLTNLGFKVISVPYGTDSLNMTKPPKEVEMVICKPPFNLLDEYIELCYNWLLAYDLPFVLLLPAPALHRERIIRYYLNNDMLERKLKHVVGIQNTAYHTGLNKKIRTSSPENKPAYLFGGFEEVKLPRYADYNFNIDAKFGFNNNRETDPLRSRYYFNPFQLYGVPKNTLRRELESFSSHDIKKTQAPLLLDKYRKMNLGENRVVVGVKRKYNNISNNKKKTNKKKKPRIEKEEKDEDTYNWGFNVNKWFLFKSLNLFIFNTNSNDNTDVNTDNAPENSQKRQKRGKVMTIDIDEDDDDSME